MKLLLFLQPMSSLPLWGRVRACLQFKPAPLRAPPAVAHQTTPSPVGEGRGGGSKQAALAMVYKTNCKQPLGWGQQTTAQQVWNFVGLPCQL